MVPELWAVNHDEASKIVNAYVAALKSGDDEAIRLAWNKFDDDPQMLAYIQSKWPNQYNSYQLLGFSIQLSGDRNRIDATFKDREKRLRSQLLQPIETKRSKPITNGEVARRYPNFVSITNRDVVINNPNLVISDNRQQAILSPNQILPSNKEILENRIESAFGPIERRYGINPQ